ncbi:MAG: hypothetical protein ABSG17_02595 [Spirochaetia bacterium]
MSSTASPVFSVVISNALRFSELWGKLMGIPRSPSPVSHVCSTDLFSQHSMQATVSPHRPSIGAYMQSSASPALSLTGPWLPAIL